MATYAPWAVKVLTTDYLVEGEMDGNYPGNKYFLWGQQTSKPAGAVTLTKVKFQPVAGTEAPSSATATWMVTFNPTLVAVIGNDETTIALLLEHAGKTPVPVELRLGPFALRGTLLLPVPSERIADVLGSFGFVMQNVEIDCVAAGSRLRGLKAQALLMNTALLQGALFGR